MNIDADTPHKHTQNTEYQNLATKKTTRKHRVNDPINNTHLSFFKPESLKLSTIHPTLQYKYR